MVSLAGCSPDDEHASSSEAPGEAVADAAFTSNAPSLDPPSGAFSPQQEAPAPKPAPTTYAENPLSPIRSSVEAFALRAVRQTSVAKTPRRVADVMHARDTTFLVADWEMGLLSVSQGAEAKPIRWDTNQIPSPGLRFVSLAPIGSFNDSKSVAVLTLENRRAGAVWRLHGIRLSHDLSRVVQSATLLELTANEGTYSYGHRSPALVRAAPDGSLLLLSPSNRLKLRGSSFETQPGSVIRFRVLDAGASEAALEVASVAVVLNGSPLFSTLATSDHVEQVLVGAQTSLGSSAIAAVPNVDLSTCARHKDDRVCSSDSTPVAFDQAKRRWVGAATSGYLTGIVQLPSRPAFGVDDAYLIAYAGYGRVDLVRLSGQSRHLHWSTAVTSFSSPVRTIVRGPDAMYVLTVSDKADGHGEIWRLSI